MTAANFFALFTRRVFMVALVCAFLTGGFMFQSPSWTAVLTINVNDTTDSNAFSANCISGSGTCTLRSAITAANSNAGSTINIPAGTYTLTLSGSAGERLNAVGDLNPTASMTISGAGPGTNAATATIIQAGTTASNGIDGVFRIQPAANGVGSGLEVTVKNLTVRHGKPLATFGTGNATAGAYSST